jgi:DNA helicase II / ATP-dependent DNA helicase PcrA
MQMTKNTLNNEQLEAATHIDGPLLVLAGAGSGKTRIVTQRIATLIQQGVSPDKILAVTFTNKAAEEMKNRVQALTSSSVVICTFHSLGVRILKESLHLLEGYSPDFTIYDEEDSLKLIKEVLSQLQVNEKEMKPKAIKGLISRLKNNMKTPEDFVKDYDHPFINKNFEKIFTTYQSLLKHYNALDFDDLLYLVVKLFTESPEALRYYQEKWQYLLIDEYQDTNQAQYLIAKKLVEKRHNLFVVGDPDQSIYSWRGANIENILRFQKDYPGAKSIKLEQNYRSSETILKSANYLIEKNQNRLKKKLWSNKGEGDPLFLFIARDEVDEASFIIKKMVALKERQNISLNEMVAFYRTNFQSRVLEDQLLSHNIPYQIVGGISFYQRKEIKDVIAFMRMTLTGNDLIAFKRTVNIPKRGIGEQTINKIVAFSEARGLSLLEALKQLSSPFSGEPQIKLSKRQLEGIAQYSDIIQKLQLLSGENQMQLLIETIIEESQYIEILKGDPETSGDKKANLEELAAKGAEKDFADEDCNLSRFLEEISLRGSLDEHNAQSHEKVSLMTIHNGKGLEFNTTFLCGLEEELFPHINSFESEAAIEEERRLCYVGITRAKEKLFLSASRSRFLWGSQKRMRPSRFLKELPSECIKRVYLPHEAPPQNGILHSTENQEEEEDSVDHASLEVNDRVRHKDFGEGVIEEVSDSSMGIIYQVKFFRDNSKKKLLAQYAPMQAIR